MLHVGFRYIVYLIYGIYAASHKITREMKSIRVCHPYDPKLSEAVTSHDEVMVTRLSQKDAN